MVHGGLQELKGLISRCAEGNLKARLEFQNCYGVLIYNYPRNVFNLPEEEGGDFYLYVFDKGRIFRRLDTFEGRNDIQFETFLAFYVLRTLFFEWARTRKDVDTVSLDSVPGREESTGRSTAPLKDALPGREPSPEEIVIEKADSHAPSMVFDTLDEEKRVVLKLLHLAEVDLSPDDIMSISRISGRSIEETLDIIDEATKALTSQEEKLTKKQDSLQAIFGWIMLYQRRIADLEREMEAVALTGDVERVKKLGEERGELARKLEWRYTQRRKALEELRGAQVKMPYRDIARILNLPLGTVCSKIARAREDFEKKYQEHSQRR